MVDFGGLGTATTTAAHKDVCVVMDVNLRKDMQMPRVGDRVRCYTLGEGGFRRDDNDYVEGIVVKTARTIFSKEPLKLLVRFDRRSSGSSALLDGKELWMPMPHWMLEHGRLEIVPTDA